MSTDAAFEDKAQELMPKVLELEEKTAAFNAFIRPSFGLTEFHQHYDPMTATAKAAHDIYHEMLALEGHAH
jgi:hypothetical protein